MSFSFLERQESGKPKKNYNNKKKKKKEKKIALVKNVAVI